MHIANASVVTTDGVLESHCVHLADGPVTAVAPDGDARGCDADLVLLDAGLRVSR